MNEIIYKYVDIKGLDYILKDSTLKFSKPSDFNDPFEFHESLVDYEINPSHLIDIFKRREGSIPKDRIKKLLQIYRQDKSEFMEAVIVSFQQRKESTKVSCFSKIYDSLLMWAHYTDKHRGACIEFSVNQLNKCFDQDFQIFEVNYENEITSRNISDYRHDAITHWVSTKAQEWSYENEVRLVLGSNPEEIQNINLQAVQHIYLGCMMPHFEKQRIINLLHEDLRYNWIGISEMVVSKQRFGLDEVRLY